MKPQSGREEHKAGAQRRLRVAVLTVSDTRSEATDASGAYLTQELTAAGHEVSARAIVRDDPEAIAGALNAWIEAKVASAILCTGGTGIGRRDGTINVVEALLDTPLPGFGELFRMLSYPEVGAAAMLSRATAGVSRGVLVFALPGSLNAVKTAWEKLLRDELGHVVHELTR